jgi:hypothetical protein
MPTTPSLTAACSQPSWNTRGSTKLTALYAAVVTFGRDDYPALIAEVRGTHLL